MTKAKVQKRVCSSLLWIALALEWFWRLVLPSDHAWGGHYFVTGGGIDGKKIIGKYPDDLSNDSPHFFEPGISIPSSSWDSVWNGVAQWFGITDANVSFKEGILRLFDIWSFAWYFRLLPNVSLWFALQDLDEVLPNRNAFTSDLFHMHDLYAWKGT